MPASQLDTVIEEVPAAADKGKQAINTDKPAEDGGYLTVEQRDAIPVLVNGVVVGQAKGAYTLADAEALVKAVRVLLPEDAKEKSDESHFTQEQLQSLVVIINAVNVAQSKGAYSLADAEALCQKIKLLVKSEEEPAAKEQPSSSKA